MTSDVGRLRARLWPWYESNGRHALPWRLTRDPYAVLVSEIMLQQTQVERVITHYTDWLMRWPGFPALAAASPADVIRKWRGLGYNRRAVNLQRTAAIVSSDHGGALPRDAATLQTLPGIGPYTAAAIQSFAFDRPVAVVDTNIARLLARVLPGREDQRGLSARALRDLAESILPARCTRDHNFALMDLGATVCTARAPRCDACPLAGFCKWKAAGQPRSVRTRAPAPRFEDTARFARGRIIDALRAGPASTCELAAALPPPHAARIGSYMAALEADSLARQSAGGRWELPTTAP